MSRREWLIQSAASAVGVGMMGQGEVKAARVPEPSKPFRYCLNTSTISGQKLDLVEVSEITARAGYQGIEPWIRELDAYVKQGGKLPELGRRIRDHGLVVENVIGFFDWIVEEDSKRQHGLEEAKSNMDMVHQIGATRLAAPPAGAQGEINLFRAAERYRALLELGRQREVTPQLELWGFSQAIGRLGQAAFIAIESGHAQASLLLDVYHLYKGGSDLHGLRLLSGAAMHILHFNDYPADPPRASINDAQRIYPGDGIAPLKSILRDLRAIGFQGALSLELFNRDLWKQDPLQVARTGLEKMKAVCE